MSKPYILATRGSKLALWQAHFVRDKLSQVAAHQKIEIKIIKTKGDQIIDRPLREVGGKALFVAEIEECILRGEADFAVHSVKDVPALLPAELKLGVMLEREESNDLLLSHQAIDLEKNHLALKIGTSSLRRKIILQKINPHLRVEILRGNVDTRINKLKNHEFDAIILAKAGLKRLGFLQQLEEEKIQLQTLNWISSPGQGAIGLEYRTADLELEALLKKISHPLTEQIVNAERIFLKELEGSCSVPIGAIGKLIKEQNEEWIEIKAFLAKEDGSQYREICKKAPLKQAQNLAHEMVLCLKQNIKNV